MGGGKERMRNVAQLIVNEWNELDAIADAVTEDTPGWEIEELLDRREDAIKRLERVENVVRTFFTPKGKEDVYALALCLYDGLS
jgi:3-methyladenine DNA glycosylase AlkD